MPEPVAILCSGQGGQHPAMFDLVASCPEAEPVFAAAAEVLGQDPRRFVRVAAPADLFSDLSGQIGAFVILAGRVEVTRRGMPGHSELIVTHGPGSFMGELAQLSGRPSLVDAYAKDRFRNTRPAFW